MTTSKKSAGIFIALCVSLNLLSSLQNAIADEQNQTSPASAQSDAAKSVNSNDNTGSSPAASTQASSSAPLAGGVQKVELSLEKLRDIGLDLKEVTMSARHLYDEVSIQPVSMVTEPEVIGRGIIINIPVATQAAGPPAPPNPKRVAVAMNSMGPIITTMQQNADDFVKYHKQIDVSDEAQEKLAPLVKKWVEAADNIGGQYKILETLTKGPNYDNANIAKICQNVQQDVYVLDKVRRDVYKIIKNDGAKKH
ncbi:MAG: hypothetical protein K2X27_13950 [Candidatus Obscuribacterales bacterium]|nr:hypothetical protein [Candidatus Obscuribacterales bacterium]